MSNQRFFLKFTDRYGNAPFADGFKYPLPVDGKPGKWMAIKGKVNPCHKGFHVCTLAQLPKWDFVNNNYRLFVVEVDGDGVVHNDSKTVFPRMRFLREIKIDHPRRYQNTRDWVGDNAEYFRREIKNARDKLSEAERVSWAW